MGESRLTTEQAKSCDSQCILIRCSHSIEGAVQNRHVYHSYVQNLVSRHLKIESGTALRHTAYISHKAFQTQGSTGSSRGRRGLQEALQVSLAMRVDIDILAAVQRRPFGLILEEAHSLDILSNKKSARFTKRRLAQCNEDTYVLLIRCEPMVDTSRKNNHIVLVQEDTNPLILLAADIEVSFSIKDIADLLVLVQVLGEEHLDLLLVDIAHGLRGHADLVAILVPTLCGKFIDGLDGRAVVVSYT